MTVLAVGAHPDDIELGCGGALLAHRQAGEAVWMLVLTTGTAAGSGAIRRNEQQVVARRLGAELLWGEFTDGEIPSGKQTIQVIDDAIALSGASVLYTHAEHDAHQDHRVVAQASLSAGRNLATIFGYETPSTSAFMPTTFVSIAELVSAKVELIAAHRSQVNRGARVDLEVVTAQARVRGHHGRLTLAEGFETYRAVFTPGAAINVHSGHRHATAAVGLDTMAITDRS